MFRDLTLDEDKPAHFYVVPSLLTKDVGDELHPKNKSSKKKMLHSATFNKMHMLTRCIISTFRRYCIISVIINSVLCRISVTVLFL